jgi:hypothetical protein
LFYFLLASRREIFIAKKKFLVKNN